MSQDSTVIKINHPDIIADIIADIVVKCVIAGDFNVGKSNLMGQYTKKEFDMNKKVTIGIDYFHKYENVNGYHVKMQIWDTAGQEQFRSIITSYFRGAYIFILMFDITKRKTFESLNYWLEEIHHHAKQTYKVILVGNMKDLENERTVSFQEAKEFANSNDNYITDYYELSVKENPSLIDTLFNREARDVVTHIDTFLKNTVGIVDHRKDKGDSNITLTAKKNIFSNCSKC